MLSSYKINHAHAHTHTRSWRYCVCLWASEKDKLFVYDEYLERVSEG